MRKIYSFLIIFLLLSSFAFAQLTPKGMKYQAVARNMIGEVMANKKIALKISLISSNQKNIHYTEVHDMVTNQFGLFDLVIGEGKAEKGKFEAVPWSEEDIWMQVSLKAEQRGDFITISSSKLLAVPYAFHAMTASALINKEGQHNNLSNLVNAVPTATNPNTSTTSGITPSQGNSWNTGGNLGTTPPSHYLGTADNVFFVIKTNAIERMRVAADGNIGMKRSLSVGEGMNVDSSVNLNIKRGATLNYGPFTVGTNSRRSATSLLGTLTVDADQATSLGGTLDVDKETRLNSSLTVAGISNLNSNLNVNNESPTLLSGTLRVNKDATFKQLVRIDSTLNSDTTLKNESGKRVVPNGALVVMGGVAIDSNLTVNGDARFGGHTSFAGAVAITDGTPSYSPTSGALTVAGGVGVGKQLNVADSTRLNKALGVSGVTTLNDSLMVRGRLTVNGNSITGDQGDYASYPLQVQGGKHGIAVKINESRTQANNFVTFWDNQGIQGRIEGQTKEEMYDDDDYKTEKAGYVYDVAAGAIDVFFATTDLFFTATNTVAAATSATACLGLGACVTSPIPSLIASSTAQVVVAVAQELFVIAGVTVAAVNLAQFIERKDSQVGVSYQSGGADYAEYLKRINFSDKMQPGDVVGVVGGQISKNTAGVEKIMVISHKPIVLGNMPKQGEEGKYEKVAFMGQVPVRVFGKVDIGDYIIPSGKNDGVGVAVKPDALTAENIKQMVGIAWSSAPQNLQFNMVNVAVGISGNDISKVVTKLESQLKKQQDEVDELKGNMAKSFKILGKMVPGFDEALKGDANLATFRDLQPVSGTNLVTSNNSAEKNAANKDQNTGTDDVATAHPDETNIIYHKISRQDILNGVEMAETQMKALGMDTENNNFFKQMKSNPSFQEGIVTGIQKKFEKELCAHKVVNKRSSHK